MITRYEFYFNKNVSQPKTIYFKKMDATTKNGNYVKWKICKPIVVTFYSIYMYQMSMYT